MCALFDHILVLHFAAYIKMKVKITVRSGPSAELNSVVDLTVGAAEAVSSVKERVATLQLIPFPEQDLVLDGRVLNSDGKMSDCGVKEASSLDLIVNASDKILVQQLSEFLQARDLSADELGLLYCYKHGVSVNQALKMIGHDCKIQDFIQMQKSMVWENGRVTLVREDTALKPFSVAEEVTNILKSTDSKAMDIKELSSKFIQKFSVSISSVVGMKPVEFLAKEKDLFVVTGRNLVSLRASKMQNEEQAQQGMITKQRPLAPPGLEDSSSDGTLGVSSVEGQQYMELHDKICSRSFNSKVVQVLNEVVDIITEHMFLNVDHIVKGGSVGKGTSILKETDAEVVLFLRGLPPVGHDKWLPSLLKGAAGVLNEHLSHDHGFGKISSTEDSVHFCVKGLVQVNMRFAAVFDSYAAAIQALGSQGPEVRKYFGASLVKERVQFIAKQPGQVKVTIRLLKWWRDQQHWSNKILHPTDEILELMAIYSSVQTKPSDQRMAIANVMSLLSRFNELRIVWSNFYSKEDVWAPLLRQRPLLMDPTNPFVNIADPQVFDARELMSLAKTTHFFW